MTSPSNASTAEPDLDAAADAFIAARALRPRWPGIPDHLRPRSVDDGYRLQRRIHEKLATRGIKRVGYKIAAGTKAGQEPFGLSEPAFAGLFETGRWASMNDVLHADLAQPMLECEVAVIIGEELGGSADVDMARVAGAIEACQIACEIVDNRYGDPIATGTPSLIADDWFNVGFVLGERHRDWRALDLKNLTGTIKIDDAVATGHSSNVLDAVTALHWLVRKLAQFGRALRPGEIVLTGSVVAPTKFTPPARFLSVSLDGFAPLETARHAS